MNPRNFFAELKRRSVSKVADAAAEKGPALARLAINLSIVVCDPFMRPA